MAHGFGRFGTFPFDLGGGNPDVEGGSILESEQRALLTELELALDPDEDFEWYQEAYADAIATSIIWATNRRLRSWLKPEDMVESLPVWEQSTGLRPSSKDTDTERRQRVAGKLRGLINNALIDIEAASQSILGKAFGGIILVAPSNVISYWPGVNPGPPGFEWTSNKAIVAVSIKKELLTEDEFSSARQALFDQLDTLVPIWMTFQIGVGSTFIVNQGIVGQTFL